MVPLDNCTTSCRLTQVNPLTVDILHNAAFWVVIAAASELIALNPKLKANSIIQLAFQILNLLRPRKRG
jgi:hypothetical protein